MPLDSDASELFGRLRALRRELAEEAQVPAFVIFADSSLRAMAARRPVTDAQFRRIPGVGASKAENYAGPFGRAVEAFCDERGLSPWPEGEAAAPSADERATRRSLDERRDRAAAKIPTARQTLDLYREGLSLAEIAAQRNLAPSTIASHLADAVSAGEEVDVSRLLSAERLRQIAAEFERQGDPNMPLKPIKDALGDAVSYEELHLARAILRGPKRAGG